MKPPVVHYCSGERIESLSLNAWQLGVVGFLIRTPVVPVLALILLGSIPWWWQKTDTYYFTISIPLAVTVFCAVCGVIVFVLLLYLKKRTIRSLRLKYLLHKLTHETRNWQTEVYEKLTPDGPYPEQVLAEQLTKMLHGLCENVALFFRTLLTDDSISASIRLAVPHVHPDQGDILVAYKTVARSSGMHPNRHLSSEPILGNRGIPRFFRDQKRNLGILIYYDIKAAAELGAYELTKNDKLYSDEVVTMMVAPLNAWTGSSEDLLGLLHITSRRKNAFSYEHVDSTLFLADHIATVVSSMVMLRCFEKLHQVHKVKSE